MDVPYPDYGRETDSHQDFMMYKDNISLSVAPEYPLQGMLGGLAFDVGCPSCLKDLGALVWVEVGFVNLICTLPRFRTL